MIQTEKILKNIFIVGAGSAGLAAALRLKQKYPDTNIQILEAQKDHGGRVKQDEKWCDFPLELGAEELHYSDSWYGEQLKNIQGLNWHSDENDDCYAQNPETNKMEVVDDSELEQQLELYEDKIMEQYEKNQENKEFQDFSMEDFIKKYNLEKDRDMKHIFQSYFAQEFGTELSRISVNGLGKDSLAYDEDNKDPNWYLFSGKTHYQVYNEIFKDIIPLIQYETPISEINYLENSEQKIVLKSSNGQKFIGDKVIICVPITQLQNNKIKFVPELSKEKQVAINKLQMDPCVKFHMKFSKKFWKPCTKDIIIKGKINFLWDSSSYRAKKDNVISGLIFGQQVENFVNNKDKLIDEILESLSQGYQDENIKDYFQDCYYFDWTKQPYIEGGYTYPVLDEGNSRDILREPVQNSIYFAGECVDNKFFATIHGALQTGIDAAEKLIHQCSE